MSRRGDRRAPRRIGIWLAPGQLDHACAVLEDRRLEAVSACAPDPLQTSLVCERIGARPVNDVRLLGAEEPLDLAWLAADADLPDDAPRAIAARCPIAAGALPPGAEAGVRASMTLVPRLAELLDPLRDEAIAATLGAPHAIAVRLGAAAALGGLGGRLFDLAECALALLGPVESVFASFVAADGRASRPSSLRGLTGSASVLLRGEGGRAMAATLDAGIERAIVVCGATARLELSDRETLLAGHDGRVIDRTVHRQGCVARATADALVEAVDALLHAPDADSREERFRDRLALCEAMRLSALTGSAESPASLRPLIGAAGRP